MDFLHLSSGTFGATKGVCLSGASVLSQAVSLSRGFIERNVPLLFREVLGQFWQGLATELGFLRGEGPRLGPGWCCSVYPVLALKGRRWRLQIRVRLCLMNVRVWMLSDALVIEWCRVSCCFVRLHVRNAHVTVYFGRVSSFHIIQPR